MNDEDRKIVIRIIEILLGVVFGALVVSFAYKIRDTFNPVKVRYEDWKKLNVILDVVNENYVDSVRVGDMTDAAVVAALSELDPHSVYMPPVERKESETQLAGNFEGIGIQFNVPNDTAVVLEVIPGGPSEKAGLLSGDRILKVDDEVIAGVKFPQDSMVRRMKGPAGTKVTLLVGRAGEEIPFEITRGKIPLHSVDAWLMADDTTGYIRLTKFNRTTFIECVDAANKMKGLGMKRLILDLRDNTGGYLDQAVLLTNEFLSKGDKIVYIQGRKRSREDYNADGRGKLNDIGLAVLIDEGSASASEILAGAIQDNDRGVIIGRRSFGKGLVQEPVNFTDGSGIRLTVARYYTPSGRCIQKPYDSYSSDLYNRYMDGEIFSADSVKVDTSDVHYTVHGRRVFGGGGIVPDIFVPMDTTLATTFYIACNRKATQMRFASHIFDRYPARLRDISNYDDMDRFLSEINIRKEFISFALKDGISVDSRQWKETEPYLMPQLRALISRYSKLGENAFYKYYLPIDETVNTALRTSFQPLLGDEGVSDASHLPGGSGL